MTRLERNFRNTSDPRAQVTYVIWGCAVGMFALCIPLDEQTMRSLEERIANLEAIASHSELDMQHQFKQLELPITRPKPLNSIHGDVGRRDFNPRLIYAMIMA